MIYFTLLGIVALVFLMEASVYYLYKDNDIEMAVWNFGVIVVLVVALLEERGLLK